MRLFLILCALIGLLVWAIGGAIVMAIDAKSEHLRALRERDRHAYCEALLVQGKRAKFNLKGCGHDSSVNR